MTANEQLTTLTNLKAWLGIPAETTTSDEELRRLIRAGSSFVLNYLNRSSLGGREVSEIYDGYGNGWMMLRNWPVLSISSLVIGGSQTIGLSPSPGQSGYQLESYEQAGGAQRINLFGSVFPRARGLIAVTYRTGFVQTERYTIPAATPWQLSTTSTWLTDEGVSYADGSGALTEVTADPEEGEYAVASGVYTFAEADASKDVDIAYAYVPADIEQAVIELVGERYKIKDRIGIVSKTLGGQETVVFSQKDMNDYARQILQPYMRVVPL